MSSDDKYICEFCTKEFCSIATLTRHKKTTKSCLQLQGKNESIECKNCKKLLAIEYYKQHMIKCDALFEKSKEEEKQQLQKIDKISETNEKLKHELVESKKCINKLKNELSNVNDKNERYKISISILEKEVEKLKSAFNVLEKQNDRLHTSSQSITMKLAEKTTNTNNNTVVINTNQLTNEVLRQCASTFSIDNARTIKGIARHLTSSLEDHVRCTDPSRNIFKYTNEKDEEIIDQNLEILLPQYLTAVKDQNDFLYKEVFDYFEKNNVSFDTKTDYQVFYNALNNIIKQKGDQNKYTEKCKRQMVRECKMRFLEKNRNKEKDITKSLTAEEVMMIVIETGGSVQNFVDRFFTYDMDEETDEQYLYRREMEDLFRAKKQEWKKREEIEISKEYL